MAQGNTRWRPDTCGCAVEYSWSGEGDDYTLTAVEVSLCDQHGHLRPNTLQEQFEAILEHNRAAQPREE